MSGYAAAPCAVLNGGKSWLLSLYVGIFLNEVGDATPVRQHQPIKTPRVAACVFCGGDCQFMRQISPS